MKFLTDKVKQVILISFLTIAGILLTAFPVLAAAPTPDDPISEVSRGNVPAGWTLAGLLILVLLFMIYQQVRNFLRRILRRARNNRSPK